MSVHTCFITLFTLRQLLCYFSTPNHKLTPTSVKSNNFTPVTTTSSVSLFRNITSVYIDTVSVMQFLFISVSFPRPRAIASIILLHCSASHPDTLVFGMSQLQSVFHPHSVFPCLFSSFRFAHVTDCSPCLQSDRVQPEPHVKLQPTA